MGLLKMIRDITYNPDESKLSLMAIIECDLELALGFQGKAKDCDDFMAVFKAWVDTINAHKESAGRLPGHVKDTFNHTMLERGVSKSDIKSMNDADQKILNKEIQKIAYEEYLAVLFVKQADKVWYGELKTTLANGHLNPTLAECGYPKTLQGALRLLKGYTLIGKLRRHNNNNNDNDNRNGIAFVEQQDSTDRDCFGCDKKGHHIRDCPNI